MPELEEKAETKPRRGRGRPKLSEEERAARAALMYGARLANKRTEEICQDFQVSRATVYRAFDLVRRNGFLEKARDFLTLDLVPLALAAYDEALRSSDLALKVAVAEKVLDGLGVTGKHATLTVQPGGESFEDFRAQVLHKTQRLLTDPAVGEGDPAGERPPVCDGVVVSSAAAPAPPGSEAGGEDRLSGPQGDD